MVAELNDELSVSPSLTVILKLNGQLLVSRHPTWYKHFTLATPPFSWNCRGAAPVANVVASAQSGSGQPLPQPLDQPRQEELHVDPVHNRRHTHQIGVIKELERRRRAASTLRRYGRGAQREGVEGADVATGGRPAVGVGRRAGTGCVPNRLGDEGARRVVECVEHAKLARRRRVRLRHFLGGRWPQIEHVWRTQAVERPEGRRAARHSRGERPGTGAERLAMCSLCHVLLPGATARRPCRHQKRSLNLLKSSGSEIGSMMAKPSADDSSW